VLAVGDVEPKLEFASDFALVDVDRLEFADLLLGFAPTQVLHLGTLDRSSTVGAERSDRNIVLGAQALFGAIARCPDTRRVVVKSESAVYGIGPRQPSVATEGSPLSGRGDSRHQRRLRDLESFVATQADRHEGATYTVLRLAPIIGPDVGNDLSRYLALPAVPTLLGFDPRLQFLSQEDAVRLLVGALDVVHRGVLNAAAPGQLYLSRVLRLGRRIGQPLPKRGFRAARRGLAAAGIHLSEADARLLQYGRVMDTSRAEGALGVAPELTCRQTVLALYRRLPEVAPHA
jgi:UDP-glucose 4-epimerase